MCDDRVRTLLTRRAIQWEEFLQKIIDTVKENGYKEKLFKPEIERLILRHSSIRDIEKDIINGFSGIEKLNPEVKSWLKGKPIIVAK